MSVLKARNGGYRHRFPAYRTDSIRLTTHNLTIGPKVMDRFVQDGKATITIEKDVEHNALRVAVATTGASEYETYKPAVTATRLHTTRPRGLYDMPNGNYLADLKEPNVYILEA
jgi:hypothetical protein